MTELKREEFKENFLKRLIKFSIRVLALCKRLRSEPMLWPVCDQLVRSSTSIGANIVEAKSASSKLEYTRYFQIALRSANETKYWLILIEESNRFFPSEANELYREVSECSRIIAASILTLKNKK